MEEPDDDFLNFFLLNMCAPKIMALLVPVHFMWKILTEGFVLRKISVATVMWKLLLQWGFVGFKKATFGYFLSTLGSF